MILIKDKDGCYSCAYCVYRNSRTKRFLTHMLKKHQCIVTDIKHVCSFCSKIFDKGQSLGAHIITCSLNPQGAVTKEKIRQSAIGTHNSKEQREKISATINAHIQNGTWHNSFARSRKHTYKGESFDGTWEMLLAQWMDSKNIEWVRNKQRFPYFFEDKIRSYEPDFYLPEQNRYVEVKGWKTEKDEAKWQAFPHQLIVLSGSDLQRLGIAITVRNDWKTEETQFYPAVAQQ